MKLVELAVALVVLALAGAGLVDATGFPRASAYLPTAVLGLTCALSLAWAAQSVVAIRRERPSLALDPAEMRRLVTLAVLSLLYALAMEEIGFFTATVLFLPVAAFALGYRNWLGILLATAVFVAVLYGVFGLLLQTPLPDERIFEILGGRA